MWEWGAVRRIVTLRGLFTGEVFNPFGETTRFLPDFVFFRSLFVDDLLEEESITNWDVAMGGEEVTAAFADAKVGGRWE